MNYSEVSNNFNQIFVGLYLELLEMSRLSCNDPKIVTNFIKIV